MAHTAFGYDGSVRIKADMNHGPFDKGIDAMTRKVNSFGNTLKKLAGVVAVAFGTAALINFGKESIKLASDIEEVQNVIDVTFGQGAAQIEEFAQTAAEAFGLSELSAKQYTGTMGAMLKSSGLATKQAQEMSVALAGLTGDLASFYNLDTDTAFEKIRSGISGETEPLKQLGINMSVANLEAYALTKGITKSYNAMSQAEQVLLRYNYLLSVTTDAQGDFARTSGSFANQVRILQLNFDQLRIAVGNALIPIAQAVLPGINAIIAGLTKLATVFSQVTALLFGKSSQVSATDSISSSASSAAGATNDLADATEGVGNASESAAKKMKGVLAGFDELNILADNAASSVGDAAGGIDTGVPEIEIPSYESEIEGVDQLGEAFQSLGELFVKTLDDMLAGIPAFRDALLEFAGNFNDFNQKLYDAFTFDGVKERVQQLGTELAAAFNDLVIAIDWELWGQKIGAGLNLGLQFLVSFLYSFDWIALGNSLSELINGLVYEIDWYAFGQLLWAKFKIGLETFAGFFTGLDMPALAQAASDIVIGFFTSMQETIAAIDWAEIGRQVAEFLNNVDWVGVIAVISGALGEMVGAGLEAIGGFISNADPETLLIAAAFLGTKLLGGIGEKVIAPLAKEIAGNLIKQIAEKIAASEIGSLITSISTAMGSIATLLAGIGATIGGVVLAATSFFSMWNEGFSWAKEAVMLLGIALAAVGAVILGAPALVAGVIAGIVAAVATMAVVIHEHWEEIKQWFLDLWAGIQEIAGTIAEWFNSNVVEPVKQFFSGLWESVKQLASDAWTGIQSVWSAVSGWFNSTVIQPVANFFKGLWDGIQQAASSVWEAVKSVWSAASEWFSQHVTQPLASAFDAAGNAVKGAVNGLLSNVEGMINAIIKGVNWLISQMNKISFDVPDWVPGIGGNSFGINIPSISEVKLPRLANGAVIPPNQQFAAILGDQRSGMNVETPLKTIEQALRNVMSETGMYGDINITVESILDGKVVARNTVKHINSMTRSTGRSPLYT